MTDQRRCMDPSTLESILMLKLNKDLWDVRDIEIIRRQDADRRRVERATRLQNATPSQVSQSSSNSPHETLIADEF